LIRYLAMLYLPFTRGTKPLPQELLGSEDVAFITTQSLAMTDVPAMVTWMLTTSAKIWRYDIFDSRTELMRILLMGEASFLVWAGGPVALMRKAMGVFDSYLPVAPFEFRFHHAVQRYPYEGMTGAWSLPEKLPHGDLEEGLRRGLVFELMTIYFYAAIPALERGDEDALRSCLGKLDEIARSFGNEGARWYACLIRFRQWLKFQDAKQAREIVERWQDFIPSTTFAADDRASLSAYSARFHLLAGEIDLAAQDMAKAREIAPAGSVNFYYNGIMLGARSALALALLLSRRDKGAAREAAAATRAYLANAKRFVPDLVEAWRFRGTFHWLRGNRPAALQAWRRSLAHAERLGARVELARTLRDAGELLGDREPGPEWRERAKA
jgi:tetratricopeptide (TPR) repeat protein